MYLQVEGQTDRTFIEKQGTLGNSPAQYGTTWLGRVSASTVPSKVGGVASARRRKLNEVNLRGEQTARF